MVIGAAEPGPAFLRRDGLDALLALLQEGARKVIGPTVSDGAIVYDEIHSTADLPVGWTSRQAPGHFRLERAKNDRLFDYAVGPTSWKTYTFPSRVPLTSGRRVDGNVEILDVQPKPEKLAFVGVRACEIAAMLVQDRVFLGGVATDRDYVARRAAALVVAVECQVPAETCFCVSMGTGPQVTSGFDLALTELDDGFVVRSGSEAGLALLARLASPPATTQQLDAARSAVAAARNSMDASVPNDPGMPARLIAAADSPRWAEVAERCLACANCTLVCPTCFCTSVTQVSDLDGIESVAERSWDSCFTLGFARVAGGNFRPRVQDRYRQWLTHKFATWWDQFGSSGCVGCGRCITWCPVGIDVREELRFIAPVPVASPVSATANLVAVPERRAEHRAAPAPVRTDDLAPTYTSAEVLWTRQETSDTWTLRLRSADPRILAGTPGQFVMASIPALSVPPISVSRFHPDGIELTIRAAGAATRKLCDARVGDTIGLRGSLGRGWPLERASGRDVVIVTGGIGLAPLRPLIDILSTQRERFRSVRIYYGARTPADRLFVPELMQLAARDDIDLQMTVDRAGPEWMGRVGVVTTLFDQATWDGSDAAAFICGPERMMEAAVATLRARGLTHDRIWVTLERRMECGVGLCGHCQLGSFFVCKDGPVFSVEELGDSFGREGI